MTLRNQGNLACSFCGKGQRHVRKLIAGPEVYICDECVGLCNDIIDEELAGKARSLGVSALRAPTPLPTSSCRELDAWSEL